MESPARGRPATVPSSRTQVEWEVAWRERQGLTAPEPAGAVEAALAYALPKRWCGLRPRVCIIVASLAFLCTAASVAFGIWWILAHPAQFKCPISAQMSRDAPFSAAGVARMVLGCPPDGVCEYHLWGPSNVTQPGTVQVHAQFLAADDDTLLKMHLNTTLDGDNLLFDPQAPPFSRDECWMFVFDLFFADDVTLEIQANLQGIFTAMGVTLTSLEVRDARGEIRLEDVTALGGIHLRLDTYYLYLFNIIAPSISLVLANVETRLVDLNLTDPMGSFECSDTVGAVVLEGLTGGASWNIQTQRGDIAIGVYCTDYAGTFSLTSDLGTAAADGPCIIATHDQRTVSGTISGGGYQNLVASATNGNVVLDARVNGTRSTASAGGHAVGKPGRG